MSSRISQFLSIVACLAVFLCGSLASTGSAAPPGLASEPIVLNKAPNYITDNAREFLTDRDGDNLRVWVFFTDKGVTTDRQFRAAASTVSITERAMKRRAKNGVDRVLFLDLPVVQNYVRTIEDLGATLRRKSRWLNAASFDIPASALDQVGSLGFVSYMKPVATYQTARPESYDDDLSRDGGSVSLAPDALTYGPSLGQLQQINVPAVHSKGFHGEGVTLAIMDTGFRKAHEAFDQAYAEGRVLAEWDFIFDDDNTSNEAADASTQWNHGTMIWSVSGGLSDGQIYGPAYKANFILCKTEDVRSETPVEEDNWVAALEFSDSIGTDVITTSLTYSDWYVYEDLDGETATITLAANTCDSLGIIFCNSMGNSGPGAGTLGAPADAFGILACGAVSSLGTIASFSSRGPTYDGRIKPEVCAQGVSTYAATAAGTATYGGASGTSLSTPLVAGAACLMVQARPNFTTAMIRQAMMETASKAGSPDNAYGWGIIDVDAAISWGADFLADTAIGDAPLTVQFSGLSDLSPTSWEWDFGDGGNSSEQNPVHEFTLPGSYPVSLTVETSFGPITSQKPNFVIAMGDTLSFGQDSSFAGSSIDIPVRLRNSQWLDRIVIPFDLPDSPLVVKLDSVLLGSRTSQFEGISYLTKDIYNERYVVELRANDGGGTPPLAPGDGEVMIIRLRLDRLAIGGLESEVTASYVGGRNPSLVSTVMTYEPRIVPGIAATLFTQRCDVDYSNDGNIDIGDLTMLINYLFRLTYIPPSVHLADCNNSLSVDMSDVNFLISYLFQAGVGPDVP